MRTVVGVVLGARALGDPPVVQEGRRRALGGEEGQGDGGKAGSAEKLAKGGDNTRLTRFAENARPGGRNASG